MADLDPGEFVEEAIPAGSEAAAILLMLLGEEEAADVLSKLEPDEVQHLGGAMFNVANVSEDQVDGVLDLFVQRARARTTIGFGADMQIKGMMERALGAERAENVLSRITPIPTRSTRSNGWTRSASPRSSSTSIRRSPRSFSPISNRRSRPMCSSCSTRASRPTSSIAWPPLAR
jgi:flagellar motor switch protein FliG